MKKVEGKAELGMSEGTIKIHDGQVMEKMDVDCLADMVRADHKPNIPPPPES